MTDGDTVCNSSARIVACLSAPERRQGLGLQPLQAPAQSAGQLRRFNQRQGPGLEVQVGRKQRAGDIRQGR